MFRWNKVCWKFFKKLCYNNFWNKKKALNESFSITFPCLFVCWFTCLFIYLFVAFCLFSCLLACWLLRKLLKFWDKNFSKYVVIEHKVWWKFFKNLCSNNFETKKVFWTKVSQWHLLVCLLACLFDFLFVG